MPDVLLASCAAARGLDDDEPLLLAALDRAGLTAAVADWADPGVDWSAAALVVVRSTWDYARRRDEFLAWARRVESGTRLLNPAEALDRWPGDVVVKPVVSAGARDTARFPPEQLGSAWALADRILAGGRAVMVQPYLARLESDGETGLVITARLATAQQRATADAVLRHVGDRLGETPLYARVDLVPGPNGEPQVLELELTEPSLFLAVDDPAAARVATVLAARLR